MKITNALLDEEDEEDEEDEDDDDEEEELDEEQKDVKLAEHVTLISSLFYLNKTSNN